MQAVQSNFVGLPPIDSVSAFIRSIRSALTQKSSLRMAEWFLCVGCEFDDWYDRWPKTPRVRCSCLVEGADDDDWVGGSANKSGRHVDSN